MSRLKSFSFRCRCIVILLVIILSAGIIWADRIGSCFVLTRGETARVVETQDLNNNGTIESYVLENHNLGITENEREVWASPAGWLVSSFACGDANNDDTLDLLIVVWKKGSFGEDMPFWISMNDSQIRCHLFLLNLTDEQIKPIWMSSALHRPIKSLRLEDINQDGKNELIVNEGSYSLLSLLTNDNNQEITVWQWQGWGFCLQDQLQR